MRAPPNFPPVVLVGLVGATSRAQGQPVASSSRRVSWVLRRSRGRRRWLLVPALWLLFLELAPALAHAQGAGADSVVLSWTAPGDDGNVGTAAFYEIGVSSAPITSANWPSASVVPGAPAPRAAGTRQSAVVRGLSRGATYYFAIKTTDDASNQSELSNVVRWDWGSDVPPPGAAQPTISWSLEAGYPNPSRGSAPVSIPIVVPPAGSQGAALQIVDSAGHVIHRLDLSGLATGPQSVVWNGRNRAGHSVAPGVYTAWLIGAGDPRSIKLVRVP